MFTTTITYSYIDQPMTSPFKWGWDFSHWVPWMLHYPLRSLRQTRPMLKIKLTKLPSSLSRSSTYDNIFRIFQRIPMPSTRSAMTNRRCHTSFRSEIKFCFTHRNKCLTVPHQKLHPLLYGPYTITKVVGDNSFIFNIDHFLGLHPLFNLDLLRPYFPPLLDTSEIT
jgi:hypothetical protein